MAEALRANRLKIGDFSPTGAGAIDPNFQVEGSPPPTILRLGKLG